MTAQPQLWAEPPGPARAYRVAGRVVRARASVFDAFWRFAAERQAVFHRRAVGSPPPWTNDPVIAAHKFTNVYLSGLRKRTKQALPVWRGCYELLRGAVDIPAAAARRLALTMCIVIHG